METPINQAEIPAHNREIYIASSLCGAEPKMDLYHSFLLMQDCFSEYLHLLNCDNVRIREEFSHYWVILRSRITLGDMPAWDDTSRAHTVMVRRSALFVELETELTHRDGSLVALGRQQLCVLNIADHKPCKLDFLPELFAQPPAQAKDPSRWAGAFDPKTEEEPVYQMQIRSQDVDSNGHMNNIAYVRAMLGAYSVEELNSRPIAQAEVQYINESYENNRLSVMRADSGSESHVQLCDAQGNHVTMMKIQFKN